MVAFFYFKFYYLYNSNQTIYFGIIGIFLIIYIGHGRNSLVLTICTITIILLKLNKITQNMIRNNNIFLIIDVYYYMVYCEFCFY